jgi:hypothetical protein
LLLRLGHTVERLSLRASYFKRRAQVLAAKGSAEGVKDALIDMQQAYWEAATLSLRQTGAWDHYPLLNALDGAFLNAAWGEKAPFNERRAALPELLEAAADDGRRRFAQERVFFHAMAEVEAERIDALWACCDGRSSACISRPEVAKKLLEHYCDLLARLGSVREKESATNQLSFIIALLPADEQGKLIKRALIPVRDGIERCAEGEE